MSETNKRSGCKGCLIWFCVVCAVFLIVIGVAGYLGYRKLVLMRDYYTQTKPVELPAMQYSKDELDAVAKRIEGFKAVAHLANTNVQLSLSAADINAWLWSSGFSIKCSLIFLPIDIGHNNTHLVKHVQLNPCRTHMVPRGHHHVQKILSSNQKFSMRSLDSILLRQLRKWSGTRENYLQKSGKFSIL